MTNALIKEKRVSYVPGHPAIPASDGQPWMPDRWVLQTKEVCGIQPVTTFGGGAVGYGWFPADSNGDGIDDTVVQALVGADGKPVDGGSVSIVYTYVCSLKEVFVLVPGQPYIPPSAAQDAVADQTVINLNLGWNSGARSKVFLENDGRFEFKVPASVVGVVAGMNDVDAGFGYADIDHALYFSGGIARVVESGAAAANLGQYLGTDTFAIERLQGVVRYKKNGTTLYTSATASAGQVFLDASLYSGDDMLADPAMFTMGGAAMSLSALYGMGGDTSSEAQAALSFSPLTLSAGVLSRGAMSFAPLTMLASDRPYGDARLQLAPLTCAGEGGMLMPSYAAGDLVMLYLTCGATGITGEIGGAGMALQPMTGFAVGDDVVSNEVTGADGDTTATFVVSGTASNVVVGLAPTPTVTSETQVDHGILFNGGTASIIENGVVVSVVGPYTGSDVWTIDRSGTTVTYSQNGTVVYTSTEPSTGTVYLVEITLGGGAVDPGDVTNDDLAVSADGDLFATFVVSATANDVVVGLAPTPTVDSYTEITHGILFDNGSASIVESGSVVYVVGAYTGSTVWTIERHEGVISYKKDGVVVYESTEPSSGPVYLVEILTTGGATAPGDVTGDSLNEYSMMSYGSATMTLEPLTGIGYAYEGNQSATVVSSVGVGPLMVADFELVVVMNSDVSIATVFAVKTLKDAAAFSDVEATTTAIIQAVIQAQMQSTVFAGFGVPVFDDVASVWTINMDTEATTRYENFDFNSYAKIDGSYFGCKTDGVYVLEGDADGAAPIRASIDLGSSNYGTSELKSCPTAYIGVSSTGRMYLKLTIEGEEFIYSARDENEEMQVQRIDLGKGIRANYLRFEIYNSDGCDFELDSIEFNVVALSRRI